MEQREAIITIFDNLAKRACEVAQKRGKWGKNDTEWQAVKAIREELEEVECNVDMLGELDGDELADIIITCMSAAAKHKISIGECLVYKMAVNEQRAIEGK